jgi:AmmeMemoRadiSam system protein B
MNHEQKTVRNAMGAGRWFPGSLEALQATVNQYIDAAPVPAIKGRIVSAIAPHAGYQYSGKVAGYTFRALKENAAAGHAPDTVVVLGFSHRGSFSGIALMDGDSIRTPLGDAAIDQEAVAALDAYGARIFARYEPHAGEHSAENQIPFVQAALPRARLVVGLIGDHDARSLDELVAALKELSAKKRIVVIASTDLLHNSDYELVGRTDRETLALMAGMKDGELLGRWNYGSQICCGIAPVVAAMRFAKSQGDAACTVLHYQNSGDDYPESRGDWVVGYGSAVFTVSD